MYDVISLILVTCFVMLCALGVVDRHFHHKIIDPMPLDEFCHFLRSRDHTISRFPGGCMWLWFSKYRRKHRAKL